MQQEAKIRLDIAEVLRKKAPRHYKYIPRFVIRGLERLICQDELNEMLALHGEKHGVEFAAAIVNQLDVKVDIDGEENLPSKGSGRYIFVSNHPLGGLDGMAIISKIGSHFDGDIKFLVNDLLMAITPLREVFLPINKFGRQSRDAAQKIESHYEGAGQMLSFPAGLCSRLMDDGTVSDLKWQKSFVAKAIEHRRDIVPMYFEGENSRLFYQVARLRKKLGIKFNIEMALLPREMVKSRGKRFTLRIGAPIPYTTLDASALDAEAERLKGLCYELKNK